MRRAVIDQDLNLDGNQDIIPAAAIAVMIGDELVYSEGLTYAPAIYPRINAGHAFRVGSVTKSFIEALALLQLADHNQAMEDELVGEGLMPGAFATNGFSGAGEAALEDLTVRHLVQHQTGWGRLPVGSNPLRLAGLTPEGGTVGDEVVSEWTPVSLPVSPQSLIEYVSRHGAVAGTAPNPKESPDNAMYIADQADFTGLTLQQLRIQPARRGHRRKLGRVQQVCGRPTARQDLRPRGDELLGRTDGSLARRLAPDACPPAQQRREVSGGAAAGAGGPN